MHKLTRKAIAVTVGTVVLLSGAGVAFAYWTNSGTGTGTAATGTNVAVTLTQTSTPTAMAPGIAPQVLSGTFTNGNAGPVFVKTVIAAVSKVEKPLGTLSVGCSAADYTIAGTSVIQGAAAGVGAQVPVGSAGTWSGLTIEFNNTASNQDACKDAVVTIGYTTT
jgi:hypothetical protein